MLKAHRSLSSEPYLAPPYLPYPTIEMPQQENLGSFTTELTSRALANDNRLEDWDGTTPVNDRMRLHGGLSARKSARRKSIRHKSMTVESIA